MISLLPYQSIQRAQISLNCEGKQEVLLSLPLPCIAQSPDLSLSQPHDTSAAPKPLSKPREEAGAMGTASVYTSGGGTWPLLQHSFFCMTFKRLDVLGAVLYYEKVESSWFLHLCYGACISTLLLASALPQTLWHQRPITS